MGLSASVNQSDQAELASQRPPAVRARPIPQAFSHLSDTAANFIAQAVAAGDIQRLAHRRRRHAAQSSDIDDR